MIQLIEGPPRSGKSYYACNYINKFCSYDGLYNEYILKDDVLLISNIEGLKVKHWTLNHCLGLAPNEPLGAADRERIKAFFSISNFENIQKTTRKQHIILVIDEAHEIFPSGFKEPSIYEFFAFHGHIGLDVFLMTQGVESLSRMFNPLFEHIVKVTPRSKKVGSSFTYKYFDKSGKFLYPQVVRKQKLVFGIYKSFRKDEFNKPKNAVLIWILAVGFIFVCAGGLFYYGLSDLSKGKSSVSVEKESGPVVTRSKKITSKSVVKTDAGYIPDSFESESSGSSWLTYNVSGYVNKNGNTYYLINGRSIPANAKTKNFNESFMTVDYFGQIPVKAESVSRRSFDGRTTSADTLTADLGGQVEPLGETGVDDRESFVEKPDYFNRSTDIRTHTNKSDSVEMISFVPSSY